MNGGGVLVLDVFLATALMAGNMGCKHPTDNGGYEIDDDRNQQGNQGNNGQQQGGNEQGNGEQQTGWREPDFYINEELGGQRFIETSASWYYDEQDDKDQKFTTHYDNANQYINNKVAEIQELWQEKNTGSDLSNQIGTALGNFNIAASIVDNITNNYTALAPVFAGIENEFIKNDEVAEFHSFNACYHKLAHNAYKNSKGNYTLTACSSNKEMENSNNYFNYELGLANLSYDEMTIDKAKEIMNDSLTDIAQQTNTEAAVLKKVVELALYNESLYGLHDFAQINRVNITNSLSERSLFTFDGMITDVLSNTQTQSIDDRTM